MAEAATITRVVTTTTAAMARRDIDLLWPAAWIILHLGHLRVIVSLGEGWSTRIIVRPRVLRLVWHGLAFALLNAVMMWIRIRTGARAPRLR